MKQLSVMEGYEKRNKVGEIIENILKNYGVKLIKEPLRNYIYVSDKFVCENSSKEAGLSEAIFDQMFPKEQSPSILYHYTDLEGLKGITSSEILRLYTIRKRIDQGGELSAFSKAHNLTGYLSDIDESRGRQGEKTEALYKKLSDDLFYISLTRKTPKVGSDMWCWFTRRTGARLEFKVEPKWSELRPINYLHENGLTLLKVIDEQLIVNDFPPLTPWGVSRMGAFCLSAKTTVSLEDEVRLLVKRFKDDGADLTENDGKYDYWPIPIGTYNNYCKIELTGIHAAPESDIEKIRQIISGTKFDSIQITGP